MIKNMLQPYNKWKVFIINVKAHSNKRKYNLEQMQKLGVNWDFYEAKTFEDKDNFPQFSGKKLHGLKGHIGCALSHYSLWQVIASQKEQEPVLILEDDTTFTEWIKHLHTLSLPEDWDVLYVGHTPFVHKKNYCSRIPTPEYKHVEKVSPHVIRFHKSSPPIGSWAYFITPSAARRYVKNYKMNENIDVFLGQQPDIYGVTPAAFLHCDPFQSTTSKNLSVPLCEAPLYFTLVFLVLVIGLVTFYLCGSRRLQKQLLAPLILSCLGVGAGTGWCVYNKVNTSCSCTLAYNQIKNLRKKAKLVDSPEHTQNLHGFRYSLTAFDPFTNVWSQDSLQVVARLLNQLSSLGKRFWLCQGSLLGFVRHQGQPVPWHDRVTVMMECTKEKTLTLENQHWPFVTVFSIKVMDRGLKVNGTVYSSSFPIPSVSANFCGATIQVPLDVEEWLKRYPDWKTHYVTSSYDHRIKHSIDRQFVNRIPIKDVPVL